MTPPMPAPPVLCPRPCVVCTAPCAHLVGHDTGPHECTDHRLDPTPATGRAAHALDDVRARGVLRLAP